jgi:hypothetical protein
VFDPSRTASSGATRRADERTRTAYPCSLRVIGQALQGPCVVSGGLVWSSGVALTASLKPFRPVDVGVFQITPHGFLLHEQEQN